MYEVTREFSTRKKGRKEGGWFGEKDDERKIRESNKYRGEILDDDYDTTRNVLSVRRWRTRQLRLRDRSIFASKGKNKEKKRKRRKEGRRETKIYIKKVPFRLERVIIERARVPR